MGTRSNRLREAVPTCTHNLCFEQKYENSQKIQSKIVIFTAVKNRCMFHGHVFVMRSHIDTISQASKLVRRYSCLMSENLCQSAISIFGL